MCKITEPILEIKDVTYTYDGETLPIWEHLSCQFYKGKIHAISGPSGCGKSSILYLLDGLIPHMYEGDLKGSVWLDGKDATKQLPRHRCTRIGLVMQNPDSQFCTFTVEEELAFGMENLSLEPEEMHRRIQRALEYVGMTGYEKYDLNQLSGGQKQKVAIASILVMQPGILLLDEPTANLDPKSRKEIFQLIVRLAREDDITIIIVEHNIEEILEEVDELLIMSAEGAVIGNGTKEDVIHLLSENNKPADNFRAEAASRTEAGEAILEISNLSFAYPEPGRKKRQERTAKEILKGLSFDIHKQEFLAIVGENGVGKSTLMRLIFQIFQQDEGTIRLYGRPVEGYRKKELYNKIGLVFQNPENQFVTNTVFDEMMFSLKRVKYSKEEKRERVNKMLTQFHLEQDVEKSPFVLSQGQKRRLSVASMLLTNQQILFLDEPTFGQDMENRQELMKDMQQLIRQGITIIMITHDLALVKQYATRVVEIKDGKVEADMPTRQYFKEKQKKEGIGNVCIY